MKNQMTHTKAHQLVTEVCHNRIPSLELAQEVRDINENLLEICKELLAWLNSDTNNPNIYLRIKSEQAILKAEGKQ